jgi:hypothetical protein
MTCGHAALGDFTATRSIAKSTPTPLTAQIAGR